MLRIETDGDALVLSVKIVPGASRTRYLGEWDYCARIAVASPPEKGRANRELTEYLADLLGLKRQAVTVVTGTTQPRKCIRIEGVSSSRLRDALDREQMKSAESADRRKHKRRERKPPPPPLS